MLRLDRSNRSLIGEWWWTVDRYMMLAIVLLLFIGAILVMAGSPTVAERIGLPSFYFVHRHLVHIALAVLIIFALSLTSQAALKRLSLLGFTACIALMILTLIIGPEIKGAQRWIYILGFSLQPSEFMKPFFVIMNAWLLARTHKRQGFNYYCSPLLLYIMVVILLVLQPDMGMTATISAVWGAQLFLAGLPIFWVILFFILGIAGIVLAYLLFPHVTRRIDSFLDPESGDTYQVTKSLEAFSNGGFLGQGPGEGTVKRHLPDSHTDFIFAVAGEELGIIFTLLIIAIYAFIILRGFTRIYGQSDLFIIYAGAGLLIQFGLQAMINIGVTLNMLPTKGMTLPLISYGGSSMLATAISIGMILALTRKQYGLIHQWGNRRWQR